MKAFITTISVFLALCSCQKISEQDSLEPTRTISFDVGLSVNQGYISRSEEGTSPITSLVVYDYIDGKLSQEVIQDVGDNGFGTVKIDVAYGKHELIFVGHNSPDCAYDYNCSLLAFTDKVLDTFSSYQTLTVDDETSGAQSVVLDRQVAGIRVLATDAVPSNATGITISIDGYSPNLNPKTGMGGEPEMLTRSWTYKSNNIGTSSTSYLVYSFLPSNNHTVDLTITITGNDGKELVSHSVIDAPVEKNRETVISGNLFTTGVSSSITANSEWGEKIELPL